MGFLDVWFSRQYHYPVHHILEPRLSTALLPNEISVEIQNSNEPKAGGSRIHVLTLTRLFSDAVDYIIPQRANLELVYSYLECTYLFSAAEGTQLIQAV